MFKKQKYFFKKQKKKKNKTKTANLKPLGITPQKNRILFSLFLLMNEAVDC